MDGSGTVLAPLLVRLADQAPRDYITVTVAGETCIHADLTIKHHGRRRTFALVIELVGKLLLVRERGQPTLPSFCPDRHINDDGTFCLGRDATAPSTPEAAADWWPMVARYLELQLDVDQTGRWPPAYGLRHGAAADWQERVDAVLDRMDDSFRSAVRDGRIKLVADSGQPILRSKDHYVTNLRAACPCGTMRKGHPVLRRNCFHRSMLGELAYAVQGMVKAEDAFWTGLRDAGHPCCGTMKGCALRKVGRPSPSKAT